MLRPAPPHAAELKRQPDESAMTEASAAVLLAAGGTGDGGRGGKVDTVLMRPDLGLYAVAAPLGATPGARPTTEC